MSNMHDDYDDDAVLTNYIWSNYMHLVTEAEFLAWKTILAEEKAENAKSEAMARLLRERWAKRDDPRVGEALKDGTDAFLDRVRDRILEDCSEKVFINRCSRCDRIVMTPKAQQCLWCGHDWHKKGGDEAHK